VMMMTSVGALQMMDAKAARADVLAAQLQL
jgi:hypothetical protein